MRRPVSIAFQGGGAKLIGLLAAADAVSELARDDIRLTSVSGSSAGSIAALLLGAGANFSRVKAALREERALIAREFRPFRSLELSARAALLLFKGKPLYRIEAFNDVIYTLLGKVGIDASRDLDDVLDGEIATYIIASDLYAGRSIQITTGSIRDAVRRSCAIPLVFASHRSDDQGQYADGGIFDNLPTEVLLDRSGPDDPVFAIGFAANRARPSKSTLDYMLSLTGAVVTHNVNRSRALVGDEFVFEISTALDTLDFTKMVSLGVEKEYDQIKASTRTFFEEWLRGVRPTTSSGNARREVAQLRSVEKNLVSHIQDSFESAAGQHDYVRMTVDAYCLAHPNLPDEIRIEQLLEVPAGYALPGVIVPLINGSGIHASVECDVRLDGPEGDPVPFTQVFINHETPVGREMARRNSAVILFSGNASALSGRRVYILKRERRFGFMAPFATGVDELAITAAYWGARSLQIQLNTPDGLGAVVGEWSCRGTKLNAEELTVGRDKLALGWSAKAARLDNVPRGGQLKGMFRSDR